MSVGDEKPSNKAAALDPVALAILSALADLESGKSLDPQDVARSYAAKKAKKNDPPDLWRRYLPAVRQQALFLARKGDIILLRKGKPVEDPNAPVKGVIRMVLPANSS